MGCGKSKPVISQEALVVDRNRDGLISKDELARYVQKNEKMYAMLSVVLSLPQKKCSQIATEVAYQMCKKVSQNRSLRDLSESEKERSPTIEEFQNLLDFLDDPNGQQEFFQRTVFATYDKDNSGYIEPNELDDFLDVFYQAGSIFAGDARLPKKSKLKKEVMLQFDKNNDGKLEFSELRVLISGGLSDCLKLSQTQVRVNRNSITKTSSNRRKGPSSSSKSKSRRPKKAVEAPLSTENPTTEKKKKRRKKKKETQ